MRKKTRRKSNADLRLIQHIARESRSETLARLQAIAEGLSSQRAKHNRAEYGANEIGHRSEQPIWRLFLASIFTPFTAVLLILTLLTSFTSFMLIPNNRQGNYSLAVMLIMLLVSIMINFGQKLRIAHVTKKLLDMVTVTTNIRRDGENKELPTDEVVVGDVINISAGDMIPADMRLLTSKDLFVSSSFLDGNAKPQEKVANLSLKPGQQAERQYANILYEGMTIVSGSGTGIVFAVGNHTLFGKRTQQLIKYQVKKTLFDRELKKLGRVMILVIGLVILLLLLINGWTKGKWGESLIFSLAAAVGFTPEMLPIIVGSDLTRGATELAKQGAAVKHLNAIQDLGSTDVVCIDKTGTLTQNHVVLERHYDLSMQETPRILKFSYLNAYYQTGMKDLIDKAIIDAAGDELNVNEIQRDYNKIDEIPFDYTRKRMSVVVVDNDEHHGQHLLVTKGAAEGMLAISDQVEVKGQCEKLTPAWRQRILKQIAALNDDGLRVLLLGYRLNPAPVGEFSAKDEKNLTIIGYVAYLDPPKESTKEALRALKDNHVHVKIFTGDNEAVTRNVCLEVGLNVDTVYSGPEIKAASPKELAKIVEKCNIFVRLTPFLRTKIIKTLQANGHTVSYMGDGNKDSLAMKASDVAFSVNKAVDIAKESADIILQQTDLKQLGSSLLLGRKILTNTMKYIKIILATNFGNLLSLLVASLLLPFLPMLPLQLLLLDLLYSISCLAIPFDRVSPACLKRPQKWYLKKWPKFVACFGPLSSVIDLTTMALLFYFICPQLSKAGPFQPNWHFLALFYAGMFLEAIWLRQVIIYNLRDEHLPFWHEWPAPMLLLITGIVGLIGNWLVFARGQHQLGFASLPAGFLGLILALAFLYTLLVTLAKRFYLRHNKF